MTMRSLLPSFLRKQESRIDTDVVRGRSWTLPPSFLRKQESTIDTGVVSARSWILPPSFLRKQESTIDTDVARARSWILPPSFLRKQESTIHTDVVRARSWIPAFAGMTGWGARGPLTVALFTAALFTAALSIAPPAFAQPAPAPSPAAADCKPGSLPAARYERRFGPLTDRELSMARIAWTYFENNTQPTGLANAVDSYPSTTMWDTASYLGAVVAAKELALITPQQADERLGKAIAALGGLSFFRDELPNKVYHTKTLEKVDYGNNPGEIGYSALDLGRLLVWLKIVKERYPQHADAVDRFVLRWKWGKVVDRSGMMFGAILDKDRKVQYVQEGRLGYEEYAAKGFELWGISTELASRPEPYATVPIYCVEVPYDSRDPRKFYQHNYVVTESYALDGIEFNWDTALDRDTDDRRHTNAWMLDFANRVYQAQENRWRATGILTARSEHQLDAEPYFVYDTVFTDGYAWNTITEAGQYVPQYAAVSLKAALGMWALWKSDYTDKLFEEISKQADPQRGWMEAILENGKGPIRAFTANNNGIMLETLLFKAQGKLLKWGGRSDTLWDRNFRGDPHGPLGRTSGTTAPCARPGASAPVGAPC